MYHPYFSFFMLQIGIKSMSLQDR